MNTIIIIIYIYIDNNIIMYIVLYCTVPVLPISGPPINNTWSMTSGLRFVSYLNVSFGKFLNNISVLVIGS